MVRKIVRADTSSDAGYFCAPPAVQTGLQFEEYILHQMAISGAAVGKSLRFEKTHRVGDGGRDIIVRGNLHSLFDQALPPDATETLCEIKYSSGTNLKLASFANSLVNPDSTATDIVVICNNTPSPKSIYSAQKNVKKWGKRLTFITGHELNMFFRSPDNKEGNFISQFQVAEHIYPCQVYYYLKNLMSDTVRFFQIEEIVDETVDVDSNLQFMLGPGDYASGVFEIHDVGDNIKESAIQVRLRINDQDVIVQIDRRIDRTTLKLPFWGSSRIRAHRECLDAMVSSQSHIVAFVEGAAGMGKTRFAHELADALRARGRTVLQLQPKILRCFTLLRTEIRRQSHLLADEVEEWPTGPTGIGEVFRLATSDPLGAIVVILEDLHEYLAPELTELHAALSTVDPSVRRRVVVTSRNDNTFLNAGFFKFYDSLHASGVVSHHIRIDALSTQEEFDLIHDVVPRLMDPVVERIQYISNGNPFFLMIALEWFIENDLFQVIQNQKLAIVDSKHFARLENIPREIDEIFRQSLYTLMQEGDPKLLEASALRSLENVQGNFPTNLAKPPPNAFVEQAQDGRLVWRHQLARDTFCRLLLADPSTSALREAVFASLQSSKIRMTTRPHARLAYHCGDYVTAWKVLSDDHASIAKLANITSLDIDPGLFEILPLFANLAFRRGDEAIGVKALVLRCYIGCHHANLALGEMACEDAIAALEARGVDTHRLNIFAVRLLALRAAIDGGMLNRARMLATLAEIDFKEIENSCTIEQRFEYFVDKSDVHRIANDRQGARYYLSLARKLLSNEHKDLAFVWQSQDIRLDPEGAVWPDRFEALLSKSNHGASQRHRNIARCFLTRYRSVMGLLNAEGSEAELEVILAIIKDMADHRSMSALPLGYRAAGAAAFIGMLSETRSEQSVAEFYRLAQNSCILKGETESLPAVLSDIAILEFRRTGRVQDALIHLDTAIQILSRQGRLDLGAGDLVSSNQLVVSNYVKLLSRVGYRRTIDFILDRVDWSTKPSQATRTAVATEIERLIDTTTAVLFATTSDPFRVVCPHSRLTLIG